MITGFLKSIKLPGIAAQLLLLLLLAACQRSTRHKETVPEPDKMSTDSIVLEPAPVDSFMVTDSLPVCINYKESEFDGEEGLDYLGYAENDREYLRGKRLLSAKALRKYGFGDSVYLQNIWQLDTIGVEALSGHLENTHYYLVDTVLHAARFTGIIIEQLSSEGTQKFLFNFDRSGRLMGKLPLAMFYHSGSYSHADGGRRPWWAKTEGCIGKDMSIVLDVDGIRPDRFIIHPDGRITRK